MEGGQPGNHRDLQPAILSLCPISSPVSAQILVEEGHIANHLVHIWQLIVRHGDLYYPSRCAALPAWAPLADAELDKGSPGDTRRAHEHLVGHLAASLQ